MQAVRNLPEVGQDLQDHVGVALTLWVSVPTYSTMTGPLNRLVCCAQWLLPGSGPAWHDVKFDVPHRMEVQAQSIGAGRMASSWC